MSFTLCPGEILPLGQPKHSRRYLCPGDFYFLYDLSFSNIILFCLFIKYHHMILFKSYNIFLLLLFCQMISFLGLMSSLRYRQSICLS